MPLRSANETDRQRLAPVLAHSFSLMLSDVPAWLERTGHDNHYVLEEDGVLLGSFIGLPMAQFFGGKRVPMLGIAGVAVPLPARGKGVGDITVGDAGG